MLIAHKIALNPNDRQATDVARAAGVARFADNSLPKPSQQALRRPLNASKREQFPWLLDVTKNPPQMAIIQRGEAFKNVFAGRIRMPNLGWVRRREPLRFAGKLMSATISRVADRWFVSIAVDSQDWFHLPQAENQGAVGVDLGVSALATRSTGEPPVPGPKAHTALLARLKTLSRSLSRKEKCSANRKKAKAKLAKLHARIANYRSDALHQRPTSRAAATPSASRI